jgi:hypothetical protein
MPHRIHVRNAAGRGTVISDLAGPLRGRFAVIEWVAQELNRVPDPLRQANVHVPLGME